MNPPSFACPFCEEERREAVCPSCVTRSVREGRTRLREVWATREAAEAALAAEMARHADEAEAASLRGERARIEALAERVEREENACRLGRDAVDRGRERVRRQAARLAAAAAALDEAGRRALRLGGEAAAREEAEVGAAISGEVRKRVGTLLTLYDVRRRDEYSCNVCGVTLPDAPAYLEEGRERSPGERQGVAAALGHIAFLVSKIADTCRVPLPHWVVSAGSASYVQLAAAPEQGDGDGGRRRVLRLYLAPGLGREGSFRRAVGMLDHSLRHLAVRLGVSPRQLQQLRLLPNLLVVDQVLALRRPRGSAPAAAAALSPGAFAAADSYAELIAHLGQSFSGAEQVHLPGRGAPPAADPSASVRLLQRPLPPRRVAAAAAAGAQVRVDQDYFSPSAPRHDPRVLASDDDGDSNSDGSFSSGSSWEVA